MTIEKNAREQMNGLLPVALITAVNSYRLFMNQSYSKEPAEHKNYHQAQNACLSHIEHIIKLIGITGPEAPNSDSELEAALYKAREEIGRDT